MKRLTVLILAVLLLLCSCAAQPEPVATTPPVESIPVTEPVSIYDADSKIETETDGAIKAYPLNLSDAVAMIPVGSDFLLFSGENTTLTKFTGETLRVCDTAALDCSVSPSDPAVQVSEQGITYYDSRENAVIFLDPQLKEVKRFTLPENRCGVPALSADCRELYYCTSDALRCIDLETKLDRLVKEMYFSVQTPAALHCDDTVIVCDTIDENGNRSQLYIRTATGELLYEDWNRIELQTRNSSYFAQYKDGIYTELLIGDSEQGPTLLTPHTYGSDAFPLLENGGVVLATKDALSSTMQLDYYDLRSGTRTNSITLDGQENVRDFHGADDSPYVWFLRYDPQYECDVLYCWDLAKSAISDGRKCFSARYTAEKPDYDGLFSCREIADELSSKYGVQVLLWRDATAYQPWDYTLVPEYQVPVIREKLKELEQFLSMYPEGFLEKCAEKTTSGRIQICLVRSILGNDTADGSLEEAVGLQYWDQNRNTYLCLSVKLGRLSQNACHEMSHIIDSRVLTLCKAYDDWNKLNPAGFQYSYGYTANQGQDAIQWTQGATRAFIDTYSMTYPKEDRARIMEYAMMDGNEAYFESEAMQKKLRQLCLGIREAFDLKKSVEVFRWEQYLNKPLNHK